MKHIQLFISGRVQHVGFRFFTLEAASRYCINGFVMNTESGAVYVEAEGLEEDLGRFRESCLRGPAGARVDHVEEREAPLKHFTRFEIKTRDFQR